MSSAALNYKPFNKGSLRGFFDLRYHGLTIKGCRLMDGKTGPWLAFPQQKGEENGEVKYFDQMFLTKPEAEHVRRLVLADLQAQGHIERPASNSRPADRQTPRGGHRTPDGEDVSDYYDQPDDSGEIPF